ncbi:Nn.00g031070.m01.CDS01 [Neocucurbitaria sp. VM-36]
MAPSSIYVPDINNIHADASASNNDPFKFSHGLTGVDQPSNYFFVHILVATALVPIILAIAFRIVTSVRNERRRDSAIDSCLKQDFWTEDQYPFWGLLKRHFIYGPLLSSSQNREERTISTVKQYKVPTRPQLAVIVLYVFSNVVYCLAIPEQPQAQIIAAFRGRCGTLAAFNMIFTVLFALRNNPLIWMLHVSYDTFNLFHRWTARVMVLESIAHVFAFAYNAYHVTYNRRGGWNSVKWILQHSLSYRWGLTAWVTLSLLMIHSVGPIRHAFYDSFLSLHRIGIVIVLVGIYFHLAKHALPQLPWIYLAISLWTLEVFARFLRILHLNLSWKRRTWTRVTLEALPGDASHVMLSLPRSWNVKPGSHVHIYFPMFAFWSSHPFSVAWSQSSRYAGQNAEKSPLSVDDLEIEERQDTISCVIRARTGMTRSLYKLALTAKDSDVELWGAVEGPYGGHHSLDSYGTAILFAAGVGITHQLLFVRHLLAGHGCSTAATQKILLVWCISHTECLQWIQPWLEELTTQENFKEVVRIRIHISRMTSLEIEESQLPVLLDIKTSRCDPQEVVDEEIMAQVGAMVVSVCGPVGFNASVRDAVRCRVGIRSIDFIEEVFSY